MTKSREKAEETRADQTKFVVDERRWKGFMEALSRPPREKPRLRELFRESHIAQRRS